MQNLSGQKKKAIVFFAGKIFLDAAGKHTRYELEYWDTDTIECRATFDRDGNVREKGKCTAMKPWFCDARCTRPE